MKEITIEDYWNNLSLTEKYDFIEDKQLELLIDDIDDLVEDDIEYHWNELGSNEQISFIIEKIQSFLPHEIACYLSNKLSSKRYFNELIKEINC